MVNMVNNYPCIYQNTLRKVSCHMLGRYDCTIPFQSNQMTQKPAPSFNLKKKKILNTLSSGDHLATKYIYIYIYIQ